MVLVNSSVWIAYLGSQVSQIDRKLESLIRPGNQAVISGIIFQEVIQGVRNPKAYQLTQKLIRRLPFLIPGLADHIKAAEIFRDLVSKGSAPSTIDTLIAALAIQNHLPLFTLDSGFLLIQRHSALKLFM